MRRFGWAKLSVAVGLLILALLVAGTRSAAPLPRRPVRLSEKQEKQIAVLYQQMDEAVEAGKFGRRRSSGSRSPHLKGVRRLIIVQ